MIKIYYFICVAPVQWSKEPADKEVKMGESVEFSCKARGFPTPVIQWVKLEGLFYF